MSVAARFANRAITRAAFQRHASSMRSAARSFEPHSYSRDATGPASPAYKQMFKRTANQAVFFGMGITVLLGWPVAGRYVLQGHVQ